ncbi:MAG: type II secretion system F family protein [Chloroflexi bacterium]|nr:type II secretion system F family protein [Chloroflexota bacterium]
MVYQYAAQNKRGQTARGTISASEESVAREVLGCSGYQLIELKPLDQRSSASAVLKNVFRVRPMEMILLYRQLAVLLEAGVDIVTGLQLLQSQSTNRTLAIVLGEVIEELRNGNPLSAAFRKHPEVFSPVYCRTLQVGEQTGNLEVVLRQMADYMEKELAAARGVKGALMYPVITAIVAILAMAVIVTFVLPAFSKLYSSIGAEMPLTSRILMTISDKSRQYGLSLLLALAAGAGAFYVYSRTESGAYQLDKLLLRVPMMGRITLLRELARCGRSITLLFRAGLPMTEIMSQLIAGCSNRVIGKALADVQEDMIRGEGLSRPMAKHSVFLPMFVQMVRVGEETGTLDTTLVAVAQTYEAEVDDKTKTMISLIQPAMTVFIGLGVGFITLSMVSAMFSIYGRVLK